MIAIDQLKKSYGGKLILRGISFEAGRGEISLMVGPNGAGKARP